MADHKGVGTVFAGCIACGQNAETANLRLELHRTPEEPMRNCFVFQGFGPMNHREVRIAKSFALIGAKMATDLNEDGTFGPKTPRVKFFDMSGAEVPHCNDPDPKKVALNG